MVKRIALLGSTGSIGVQTLDVISHHPDKFQVVGLAAGGRGSALAEQISRFKPAKVSLGTPEAVKNLVELYKFDPAPQYLYGADGLVELATDPEVDLVVVATSGQHGFRPTLAALAAGKEVALANKEVLIMAGEMVTAAARANGTQLRPIDSEHSAIWQCLRGETFEGDRSRLPNGEENWSEANSKVRRLLLTASGGPFRTFTKEQMANVTVEQAMKHPNWNMGPKITIDSATLFNKGLEVIEAHWLFGLDYDRIDVVVHAESMIHSMVEFIDGSIKAQLGTPDMRLPIQYAIGYPERLPNDYPRLDWTKLRELHFELPDTERFPALRLAYEAGRKGGTYPTALAAADEEAVRFFHERRISYLGIPELVERVLSRHAVIAHPTLEDIAAVDSWARAAAEEEAARLALAIK
ncbi:MAG TPA: 1-deoxy-D-xylulose-5-phosphate reductoisomerase [Chloroflexia bacterium]|nr:1-deoxy-D-xylulose-5-phosphate reductoisomerase [Chloroflexia bacterium]